MNIIQHKKPIGIHRDIRQNELHKDLTCVILILEYCNLFYEQKMITDVDQLIDNVIKL